MTLRLHLGVMDLPYSVLAPRRVRVRVRKGGKSVASSAPAAGAQTTGDVAQYLEDRYHIMEIFWEEHKQEIADSIAQSMADALDNLIDRGIQPDRVFPEEGQADIQEAFVRFLNTREMDSLQPGVPTGAAKRGVNHALKHPYAKSNPERPSFVDTGLYRNSFRAWVEGE